jgi:hypothetical protein
MSLPWGALSLWQAALSFGITAISANMSASDKAVLKQSTGLLL